MSLRIGCLVAVMLTMGGASAAHAGEAMAGQPAPEFSLTEARGTQHSLSNYRGTFVVLEWFNHECPFVRKHYDSGNMQALQAASTGKGVVWLTIASSAPGKQGYLTPEAATQVIQQRKAKPTALLLDPDGTVGRRYGAKTTPHVFVINPEGVVIYAGALDDRPSFDSADLPTAPNYVRQALDQAMAGQPVSVASTRPYGCAVKYRD